MTSTSTGTIVFRPRLRAIIVLLVATSLMWGLGGIVIYQSTADYKGYLGICLATWIVGHVATQRVRVSGVKVQFYRFFVKYAEANTEDLRMVDRKVGRPAIVPGFAFVRKSDDRVIAELPASNYTPEDVNKLRKILNR